MRRASVIICQSNGYVYHKYYILGPGQAAGACILEFLLMATSIIWTYTLVKNSKELKASSDILDSELSSIVLNKQENLRKIVHASTAGMCYMLTKAPGMDMLPSDFCWYVWKLLLWWFYAREMVIYSKTMYTCDYYGKFTIKFVQQQHY